jgi:uncharacterized protein Usg
MRAQIASVRRRAGKSLLTSRAQPILYPARLSSLVTKGQMRMVSADFIRQLAGYGLTTATILYRMPDHPRLLQTYIWQNYDVAPRFPELRGFLDFWKRELEGPLHSVTVAHSRLIRPAEIVAVNGVLTLH